MRQVPESEQWAFMGSQQALMGSRTGRTQLFLRLFAAQSRGAMGPGPGDLGLHLAAFLGRQALAQARQAQALALQAQGCHLRSQQQQQGL